MEYTAGPSIADFADDLNRKFTHKLKRRDTWTRADVELAFSTTLNEALKGALQRMQPEEKVLTE